MQYNRLNGIVQKALQYTLNGQDKGYTLDYEYNNPKHPHAPSQIAESGKPKARNYTYDGNGNPTYYDEFKGFRSMVWDEENRLRGINDNGRLHLYTYDHTGERALKSSAESSMAVINGLASAVITHTDDYTAYVSPYFVVQKGKFTKHYFEGATRIVSKLGEGTFSHKNTGIMAGGLDYLKRTQKEQEARDKYIKGLNVPPGPPTQHGIYTTPEWTGQPYPSIDWQSISQNQEPPAGWPRYPRFNEPGDVPGPPVQFGPPVTNANVKAGHGFIPNGVEEKNLYYYHPDHLGSSSYITDKEGQIIQHTEYMAFGEVLVDEHSTSNKQPYLFNGKELDFETGLYYYGARYYDAKTSLWLNTDPLMEKYPEVSPYTYTLNNPIKYIDPTGMEPVGPPKTIFINGYLMLGNLEGGKKYWNNSFIQGALSFSAKSTKDFLSIQPIFVHYDPTPLSSAKDRMEEGYKYAQTNYSYLTKGMNIKEDYFNIVDHSMGVAFGEGVSKYLQERGWEINKVIHINGFQAADIEANKSSKQFVMSLDKPQIIDYQNTDDPVINNFIRSSPGDIKNSSYRIRENSGWAIDYIHASPISRGKKFWNSLSETLNKGNYEK